MEIGEKQVSIISNFNAPPFEYTERWFSTNGELNKQLIYIERELIRFSKKGSPIYFKYKFFKNGIDLLPLKIGDCECKEVYGDIWVKLEPSSTKKFVLYIKDYHPSGINPDNVIYIPFEHNLGHIDAGYGDEFTVIRLTDKKGSERIILQRDIFKLITTLYEISKYESWEEYLANQFIIYFTNSINNEFSFLLDYFANWEIHFQKYYKSVTTIENAQDYIKSSINKRFERVINEYYNKKSKYINNHLFTHEKIAELETKVENKIMFYKNNVQADTLQL